MVSLDHDGSHAGVRAELSKQGFQGCNSVGGHTDAHRGDALVVRIRLSLKSLTDCLSPLTLLLFSAPLPYANGGHFVFRGACIGIHVRAGHSIQENISSVEGRKETACLHARIYPNGQDGFAIKTVHPDPLSVCQVQAGCIFGRNVKEISRQKGGILGSPGHGSCVELE